MKKILILATSWEPNYWIYEKEVPYEKAKNTDLPEWDDLLKNRPLAGIGIYKKHKDKDYSLNQYVYLKIKGIRHDPDTGVPYFWISPFKRSRVTSSRLERELPENNKSWFYSIDQSMIIEILRNLRETPPEEWLELLRD